MTLAPAFLSYTRDAGIYSAPGSIIIFEKYYPFSAGKGGDHSSVGKHVLGTKY